MNSHADCPRLSLTVQYCVAAIVLWASSAGAADWPMWRCDASRSAATRDALPAALHLQWSLELPPPRPAWDKTQDRLQFDASYEPVAAGGRLFVPSMVTDSVTAYDLATGRRLWQFFTNGPVRFAPACAGNAVYFGSDDGYLYCVTAASGELRWKFRGGPSDRKIIGNDRLISTWPVRGAPAIDDGVIYFAAGVWPFMGIFIHALDVRTGEVVWTNSGSGANYLVQPHGSPAFAGVSPQGYLAVSRDSLIVPGGRGSPAGYDRATGDFLFCHVGALGKASGGYDVIAADGWFANRSILSNARTGAAIGGGQIAVVTGDCVLQHTGRTITAFARAAKEESTTSVDRRGAKVEQARITFDKLWQRNLPSEIRQVHLQAGDTLIASDGASTIFAFDAPRAAAQDEPATKELAARWKLPIAGRVWNMLVADERLVVVNREGQIFCFGQEDRGLELPHPPAQGATTRDGMKIVSPRRANWKYLDNGQPPPKGWNASKFDDAAWQSGRAELGYGDGDEATVTSFGGDANNKHTTTYFRREIEIPTDSKFDRLQLQAKIDDGGLVYLNGREAARFFMPGGEIDHTTRSTGTPDESAFHRANIDPKLLAAGRNVIAVEVHQASPRSSDVSFDLELSAMPAIDEFPISNETLADDSPGGELASLWQDRDGYCLLAAHVDAAFVEDFVQRTRGEIIVLTEEEKHAKALREALQSKKLLGRRVAVLHSELATAQLPPYLFNAIVASPVGEAAAIKPLASALRPYGGTAIFATNDEQHAALSGAAQALAKGEPALASLKVERRGGYTLVVREGPLPGAAPWTHQGAEAANTLASADTLVKAPLGVLWFGGPSHEGVLPRHGHGPTPQVVGGRLFIEGRDMLRAVDVYTGRLLWQRELPDVGLYYDNTAHHPGANAIGSNYVSLADGIYVAYGRECLRLDPATGETNSKFTLPADASGEKPYWGYVGIDGDLLIAGSSPALPVTNSNGVHRDAHFSRFAEGSARLVALDRHSGEVKWTRDAAFHFRHNAICAGGGKVYCIDRVTDAQAALLKRRGEVPKSPPTLYALDAKSGRVVWETNEQIFGTWLSYSAKHDAVVQATSKYRDRAADESGSGLAVYRGESGQRLWWSDRGYGGPVLLVGDRIVTQGNAVELLTGNEATRVDPITGQPSRWTFTRNYGCTTAIGCPNLLTFRSAAAGYFDLAGDGGTGNFGGFRSSCTANLVPADGVLSAPDYTRTCTCNYQLQTSLALVHMPEAEMWTFQPNAWNGDRVRRLGVNFGAPGDRKSADETLWLEYPSVGGRSPDVPINVAGPSDEEPAVYFREHSSAAAGGELPWVASSGVRGARTISITLTTDKNAKAEPHVVRLVFARDSAADARARFSVTLQDKTVLKDYEPSAAAAPVDIHEFRVPIADKLIIQLTPAAADATTVLSGVEIVRE